MLGEDGTLYTFVTSTSTGRPEVERLLRRYMVHKRRHPNDYPIVALDVGGFEHKNKSVGWVKTPKLSPAGYESKDKAAAALEDAGVFVESQPLLPPAQPVPQLQHQSQLENPADEMSDSIPW